MAEIGNGYGSECHLLRYLGRHRNKLDEVIKAELDALTIQWLDFPFLPIPGSPDRTLRRARWPDAEWKALDFLPEEHPARSAWSAFWPTRGNTLNWDAIGKETIEGRDEWLLVEAKAHIEELNSHCTAKEHGGLPKIRAAFESTRQYIGVTNAKDWLSPHYQYCNRIAALKYLTERNIAARLMMIYFTGDRRPDDFTCPADTDGWQLALTKRATWLGLGPNHRLKNRIHEVFLPIICRSSPVVTSRSNTGSCLTQEVSHAARYHSRGAGSPTKNRSRPL
jgi:hypothetical protein